MNKTQYTFQLILFRILMLCLAGLFLVPAGCKKSRLFSRVDSIANVPPQFHFFNSFSYDSTLNFAVDGLVRETVPYLSFSKYYPFSNTVNQGTSDQSVKLLNISDPLVSSLYSDTLSIQFIPNTSYDVFVQYTPYDLTRKIPATKAAAKPHLVFIPEEIYHPYAGTTRLRLIDLAGSNATMTVNPDQGSGTTRTLSASITSNALVSRVLNSASPYVLSQPGKKTITLTFSSKVSLKFFPTSFGDGHSYSFIAVGDIKNYQLGLEPLVRLFQVEEGHPETLTELKLQQVSFSNAADNKAAVRIEDGAFNIPGVLGNGAYGGTSVRFNNVFFVTTPNSSNRLNYWKVDNPVAPWVESTGVRNGALFGGSKVFLLGYHAGNYSVDPGPTLISLQPDVLTQPLYGQLNANLEAGKSYTLFMKPIPGSTTACSPGLVENDVSPSPSIFKFRVINMMPDVASADLHSDSVTGPVVMSNVQYGVPSDYIVLPAGSGSRDFYLTPAGGSTNLFDQEDDPFFQRPIPLLVYGGNTGTLFMMGTLDPNSINLPIVEYRRDSYLDVTKSQADAILIY